MEKKLAIADERMLKLMDYAINIMGIESSEWQFMLKIGCAPTNISNIKQGRQGFSKIHYYNACELTGASMDYLFGFTSQMMRKKSSDPLETIKQAVHALERQKRKKVATNKIANSKI